DILLDTGGGLKKAGWFFSESSEPFLLHNVDVISNIDLEEMVRFHQDGNNLATLAVKDRPTSRYLLFDEQRQLCGRRLVREERLEIVRSTQKRDELAFSGIHILSPRIIQLLSGEGPFSIIESYLDLAKRGEKILAFRADDYDWRDVGTVESVKRASAEVEAS
ncbi:MAG TPA: sugar phosphate nucleotidyltransferase, partial [Terriglobia bacterium]|nr:sugar phosphate nucleotidyltransferase [Terriglobia bacterium]